MSATRVTACVDCSTPIIGGRARCPACHSQHHLDNQPHEAAMPLTLWQALIAWFVAALLLAVIAMALIMAVRSCG